MSDYYKVNYLVCTMVNAKKGEGAGRKVTKMLEGKKVNKKMLKTIVERVAERIAKREERRVNKMAVQVINKIEGRIAAQKARRFAELENIKMQRQLMRAQAQRETKKKRIGMKVEKVVAKTKQRIPGVWYEEPLTNADLPFHVKVRREIKEMKEKLMLLKQQNKFTKGFL